MMQKLTSMREILEIMYKEVKINSKTSEPYTLTTALLTDGEECVGFGDNFRPQDLVEVFLHKGVIKMKKHA